MTLPSAGYTLDPDFIVRAYRAGYFPMADSNDGAISWYSPDPRAIIPLDGVVVSRSLRHTIRSSRFELRFNTDFRGVMKGCASREETWISDPILEAYCELHRRGHAHSVETWRDSMLVGGLYGVVIGGAFFGESMFARESDASKVAFVRLVQQLRASRFVLLDSQFINDHVRSLGAVEISRSDYLRLLGRAVDLPVTFLT